MSNKKNLKTMVYHVIIAYGEWNRKVGKIISLLEKKGMQFNEIKRTESSLPGFTILSELILKSKLNELEAMKFYREEFTPEELDEKIKYLHGNHVELFFESDNASIDPNELWELVVEKVFHGGKNLPLMFVTMSGDENGFSGSFIPNLFDPEEPRYLPARTLVPFGQ